MPALLAGARRRALVGASIGALALLGAPVVADAAGSAPVVGATAAAKPTKLTLSSSLDPSIPAAMVSFTATVSPAVNGGTLTFTMDGNAIPGCTAVQMSGLSGVDCTVPLETAGAYTVAASYSGGRSYAASSAFLIQTVVDPAAGDPQSVSATSPVSVVIVRSPSPSAGSPTITYTETGDVTSTICTIDGQQTFCGSTSATLSKLSVGPHIFEVTVSGGGVSSTAEVSWVILTKTTPGSTSKKKTSHHKRKPHGAT